MRKFIEDTPQVKKALAKIIATAWKDAGYKSRLLEKPKEIFAAEGITLPEDIPVTVTSDTEMHLNMILADRPLPGARVVDPLPKEPDFRTVYAYIHTKCREDPAFRAKFLADPTDTVRELGCSLPEGTAISVHIAREDHEFINLPLAPNVRVTTEQETSTVQTFAEEESPDSAAESHDLVCFGWFFT